MYDFGNEMPELEGEALTFAEAVAALKITHGRLRNRLENLEWIWGDSDAVRVCNGAKEEGLISVGKDGKVLITHAGMQRLRAEFGIEETIRSFCEEAIQATSTPLNDSEIPY